MVCEAMGGRATGRRTERDWSGRRERGSEAGGDRDGEWSGEEEEEEEEEKEEVVLVPNEAKKILVRCVETSGAVAGLPSS